MEQALPRSDPAYPFTDPITEANGLKDAGDIEAARRRLIQLCESDLRCPEAHEDLGQGLSGHSLGDQEILDFISDRSRETHPPAEKICFETTETAAIANLVHATGFIHVLKEFGCQFALDDFGSGLSSFAYLKNLRVHFLKIDGAFVKDIVDDPIYRAIVKSINEIGHAIGM